MTIKRPRGSGGRFFSADELKPDTEAIIRGLPKYEIVESDDGEDERFKVPITYEGDDGIWTPGLNATNILIDELSVDEKTWPGKRIRFGIIEVKTKAGTRYAKGAHLVKPPQTNLHVEESSNEKSVDACKTKITSTLELGGSYAEEKVRNTVKDFDSETQDKAIREATQEGRLQQINTTGGVRFIFVR